MKITNHSKLTATIVLLAIFALIMALLLPRTVKAQPQIAIYQTTTITAATNTPAVVTTGAISNFTSIVQVPQKTGLSFSWKFNVSSGTSAGVVYIYPSQDGTNFDSVPWLLARNANGATDQVATTNWYRGQLSGYRALKLGAMTNASGGTLTNKGAGWGVENP